MLKDLVTAEVTALGEALNGKFESQVKTLIFEDHDRHKRRLNIVLFGVDSQTDDAWFVHEYLANNYNLHSVPISNIHCLVDPKASGTPNPPHPPPIMFSVPDFKTKKFIHKKSFETKVKVQFRNAVLKNNQEKDRNCMTNFTEDKQAVKLTW